MAKVTQENRLLQLVTPLGKDVLLIRSIDGMEGISQLFNFRVEAFAANEADVDFSKLVGSGVSVRVALRGETTSNAYRYYHGLVQTVTRGARGNTNTAYSLQCVPSFWMLTRTTQSRIYQQKSVSDILKDVLKGLDVAWELQGTYEPRDYCVQYRESDFDFASRLMEEEGIFYYFRHSEDGHQMVVADGTQTHKDQEHVKTLYYDEERGGMEDVDIVYAWEKSQTLRSGKTALWDHSFQLPHKSLDEQELILDTIPIGKVTHKLKIAGNDNMELYDFPGGYAARFDGINPSGGEQPAELQKIFQDNKRTVKIRMQQEAVNSLAITAYTGCLAIASGFRFTLERHYEDNDIFLITRAHFSIPQAGGYAAGDDADGPPPEIVFNCIPFALPYRPQRLTPKPLIHGTQTAVVVGPPGDEIFTDKYGRVKVQFLWDRNLKFDGSSSCWVRVAFPWAGKQFGFISIPRIGHEVVVAFEEGDPDQPLIVGSVYNPDMMPPWTLPDNKTQSGIQTRTDMGGSTNLNVLKFEDKKGSEFIFLHGEKQYHTRVKEDTFGNFGRDVHRYIERDLKEEIKNEVHQLIKNTVYQEIKQDLHFKTGGKQMLKVVGNVNRDITAALNDTIGGDHSEKTGGKYSLKANEIAIEATTGISLKVGGSNVVIDSTGVSVKGSSSVTIMGSMVKINSGPGSPPKSPTAPAAAVVTAPKAYTAAMEPTETGSKTYSGAAQIPPHYQAPKGYKTPQQMASQPPPPPPSATPTGETKEKPKHFIEIELVDEDKLPVSGEFFEVITPEGTLASGTTDEKGFARIDGIDPGNATIRFPNRDKTVLEP